MARQFGSVSAGYVAPPAPPGEIMIFEIVADYNPGQVDNYINILQNKGTWYTAPNTGGITFLPIAGTIGTILITCANNVATSDLILHLYSIVLGPIAFYTISVGTSTTGPQIINQALPQGDGLYLVLEQAGDTNRFVSDISFTSP
jgi:hypothetical protein